MKVQGSQGKCHMNLREIQGDTQRVLSPSISGIDNQDLLKEVHHMRIEVKCEVENCKYWAEGDQCVADSIMVVANRGNQAVNEKETICDTFEKM